MLELYHRYLQGHYQEVYDELFLLQERVYDDHVREDGRLVAKEIMRRVRWNIELIIPRLRDVGYQFGEGFWNPSDNPLPEERAAIEKDIPVLGHPTPETPQQVAHLEKLVGPLPLSLTYCYTEVGSVNLIGSFSSASEQQFGKGYGYGLDPLFVYSVEMALQMVATYLVHDMWKNDPILALSPDSDYKYARSGSGVYGIHLPCKAFDAYLLLEPHHTTFVNYLRLCFQWGGFPGLEQDCRLSREELAYLTKDLLPF